MAVLSFRNFTGLADGERDLILAWRNTDRVRLRMTNRDLLSREEHFRFIDSLSSRTDRAYYLFSVDGEPAGVLDFVRIDAVSHSCEPGAYIGDERFLGFGFPLYHCALAHAFDVLGCVVVKGTVRKDNPGSSAILRRIFGARNVGETADEVLLEVDRPYWEAHRAGLEKRMRDTFGVEEVRWS